MSDITSTYITIDETFLTHFSMGKLASLDGINITVNMSFRKINGDSSTMHKIGNIAEQYRPNSSIKYTYTYCPNTPFNNIIQTNIYNININDITNNLIIESDGDMFIKPDISYVDGSITSFNLSYTI